MGVDMHISEEGLSLIKKFEGCPTSGGLAIPYYCPAGVLTIGYGHTRTVKEHDKWTLDHASYILKEEIEEEYEPYIHKLVSVPLEQNQFDALVAWVFNLGPTNLQESTLLKVLNEGKYNEVPNQIRRWNKANGQVLDGLIRRREAEALMFAGEDWFTV
tara:strand:+ start:598 stop:1071 length:474 start_codon:yes stop_codon:yes gene_type:complete